jgi:hypothetical protein
LAAERGWWCVHNRTEADPVPVRKDVAVLPAAALLRHLTPHQEAKKDAYWVLFTCSLLARSMVYGTSALETSSNMLSLLRGMVGVVSCSVMIALPGFFFTTIPPTTLPD